MDKKLKALQKQWYKKLAQAGFKDIEDDRGNLREYASRESDINPEYAKSVQEYYEAARALVHTNYVQGVRARTIWRRHAEGERADKIAKSMGLDYETVLRTIHEVEQRYILPRKY